MRSMGRDYTKRWFRLSERLMGRKHSATIAGVVKTGCHKLCEKTDGSGTKAV